MKFIFNYNPSYALIGFSLGDHVLRPMENEKFQLIENWISVSVLGFRFSLYREAKND